MQCINNLKQIGLGTLTHEQTQKHYPTGGWGCIWVGDASRGFGRGQPGGFFYNILPFMEYKSIHDLSKGDTKVSAGARNGAKQMNMMPMSTFTCPTRRPPMLLPAVNVYQNSLGIINCAPISSKAPGAPGSANLDALFHSDYKANAGTMFIQWFKGPLSWADAENSPDYFNAPGTNPVQIQERCNGVAYQRSIIAIKDIVDGTTHTYLAGEKYCDVNTYYTGADGSDDSPFLGGDDYDLYGWTTNSNVGIPRRDVRGLGLGPNPFGSAHPYTFNMVMCDGSVKSESYDIAKEMDLFKSTSCRNDRYFKKNNWF